MPFVSVTVATSYQTVTAGIIISGTAGSAQKYVELLKYGCMQPHSQIDNGNIQSVSDQFFARVRFLHPSFYTFVRCNRQPRYHAWNRCWKTSFPNLSRSPTRLRRRLPAPSTSSFRLLEVQVKYLHYLRTHNLRKPSIQPLPPPSQLLAEGYI